LPIEAARAEAVSGPIPGSHRPHEGRWQTRPELAEGSDAMHSVLCGASHNLRMILRKLKVFYAIILAALLTPLARITPGA
jgi:hypothetical protein